MHAAAENETFVAAHDAVKVRTGTTLHERMWVEILMDFTRAGPVLRQLL